MDVAKLPKGMNTAQTFSAASQLPTELAMANAFWKFWFSNRAARKRLLVNTVVQNP